MKIHQVLLFSIYLVLKNAYSAFRQFKFLLRKSGEALAQAAQGSGGVTVPGGDREPWRCGTGGRGQWAWWGWVGGWSR